MRGAWRLGVGLVFMAVAGTGLILALILLLPSRTARIKLCNYWGWFAGRVSMAISGSTLTVHGAEHLRGTRPAIYVSNHTSALDVFMGIWQAPVGTVGVAKKEVVWYPFFGQAYFLSGHLRVDRGDHARAVAAMAEMAAVVRAHGLSIWMWPEGTRSRDGHLLPFKKGFVHLALATGLPVVPVVVSGAHRAWEKGSNAVAAVPITMTVLPAIDTSGWAGRPLQEVVDEVHAVFARHLPADQAPLASSPA